MTKKKASKRPSKEEASAERVPSERPCATPDAEAVLDALFRAEDEVRSHIFRAQRTDDENLQRSWNAVGVVVSALKTCVQEGRLDQAIPLGDKADAVRKKIKPLPHQLRDSELRDSALAAVTEWIEAGAGPAGIPAMVSEVTYRLERLVPSPKRYRELLHCWLPSATGKGARSIFAAPHAMQVILDCERIRAGTRWDEAKDYVRAIMRALGIRNANNAFKHDAMKKVKW